MTAVQISAITLLVVLLLGTPAVFIAHYLARRLPRRAQLQPYYRRLRELRPDAVCECRRGRRNMSRYADCCRPRDVAELQEEAMQHA